MYLFILVCTIAAGMLYILGKDAFDEDFDEDFDEEEGEE